MGLSQRLARAIADPRRQSHIAHELEEWLSQRSYLVSCGYEDADDGDHGRATAINNGHSSMPLRMSVALRPFMSTRVFRPGKTPNAGEILSVLKRIVRQMRTH